jgi:hypothetical protein
MTLFFADDNTSFFETYLQIQYDSKNIIVFKLIICLHFVHYFSIWKQIKKSLEYRRLAFRLLRWKKFS